MAFAILLILPQDSMFIRLLCIVLGIVLENQNIFIFNVIIILGKFYSDKCIFLKTKPYFHIYHKELLVFSFKVNKTAMKLQNITCDL